MQGVIIQSTGSWYVVRDASKKNWNCRLKGKLRLDETNLTNPVAVGDIVVFDLDETTGDTQISEILPRRNYMVRESPRRRMGRHILAANIDYAVILMTIKQPNLKLGFLDRYLTACEMYSVQPVIVVNKIDVLKPKDMPDLHTLTNIYGPAGMQYPLFHLSAHTGEGVDDLKTFLRDKVSLVSGNSGAGKSTLVNRIMPGVDLRTNGLSKHSGKGQHTTTFYTLFPFDDCEGGIIDSPGIKELGLMDLQVDEVGKYYRDISTISESCKFSNCQHLNEPGCAVMDALVAYTLPDTRYDSYISIREEIKEKKYWEIGK